MEDVDQALTKTNIAAVKFCKNIKNFKFLKTSDILRKFESLVLSVLFYNCEIWVPLLTETQFEKIIEAFYRKQLRWILKVHGRPPKSVLY